MEQHPEEKPGLPYQIIALVAVIGIYVFDSYILMVITNILSKKFYFEEFTFVESFLVFFGISIIYSNLQFLNGIKSK